MSENKPIHILCCDDEVALCELVAEELEDAGFLTTKAYSGREALEKIKANTFDAVVSDIRMPDGDGFSLLKSIKSMNLERPIVFFMTGHTEIKLEDAYHEGVAAVLKKPIDYSVLVNKLQAVLKNSKERYTRKSPRAKVDMEVKITLQGLMSGQNAKLIDIGNGGCFLAFDDRLPAIGSHIGFEIIFIDGKFSPIKGIAICRWIRNKPEGDLKVGIGIEFEELDETSYECLQNFLKVNPTKSYIPAGR